MQETQIILHIRSMYFRSKFIEISDQVTKPKLYYIENQIAVYKVDFFELVGAEPGESLPFFYF